MNQNPYATSAAVCAALLTAACGSSEGGQNILDAAAIFEANPEAFVSIRATYPGPFTDFARVPARNPANETPKDKKFINQLRKNVPVEFIDFFPLANTGEDEIDVIIERYSADAGWTVISLVYSGIPLPSPDGDPNMALFDKCDQRALEWLALDHAGGPISVFCRINKSWYAHQSVR